MITLADEIMCALPTMMEAFPRGPTVRDLARHLSADEPNVRRAFGELDGASRAIMVRRKGGRAFYLLPSDFPIRACKNCHVEYERPKKSKRVCCSRACGIAWSWTLPGVRERRKAAIVAVKMQPEQRAKCVANNHRRWARPGEREKLSEQNRKRWADPIARVERGVAIARAHGTPEKREFYAELRRREWQDPETREKRVRALRRSKSTPEARAKFSKLLKARWRDPVLRKKYEENNRRNNERRFGAPTPIQASVLTAIRELAGQGGVIQVSTGVIGERVGATHGTVAAAIKSLIRKGLVSKSKGKGKTCPATYSVLSEVRIAA